MKKRKHPVLKILILLLCLLALLLADSRLRLVTTEYTLRSERLPDAFDGFRVVQLSDLHGAVFGKNNRRLLSAVAEAAPDLIAITGDLADKKTELAEIDTLLVGLRSIAPVYYVSGNHEWTDRLLEPLSLLFARQDVTCLRNEYLPLERDGGRIILMGAEDPNGPMEMLRPDALAASLRGEYPDEFVLCLAHRNDWVEKYPALPIDIVLCGHAHGGLVRLPVLGGVIGRGGELFPDYTAGLYDGETCKMLVSRGLGSSTPIPRFLNNPEIVALTLKAA